MKISTYRNKQRMLRRRRLIVETLESRRVFAAIRDLPSFNTEFLARNDDSSSELVSIGFDINFFGKTHSALYVNNNGNVTFDSPLSDWTPDPIDQLQREIIAPFWADVDTRNPNSGVVRFGQGEVDGRSAFGVNWIDVGYFQENTDKLNSFQLVLINRNDISAGAFDIEFNYDKIQWETGDDGGDGGVGGNSARAGFSNGSFVPGSNYELVGSGLTGSFLPQNGKTGLVANSLKSGQAGRYVFEVRNGTSLDQLGLAGQKIDLGNGVFYLGNGIDPRAQRPVQLDNVNSADTMNVEAVRPGGSLGLSLDGSGVVVGVWDGRNVRANHQEFGGRVTFGTEVNAASAGFSDHATHVTGTILASGVNPDALGIANAASAINFDNFSPTTDLQELTANALGIDISNHSYGPRQGWKTELNNDEDPLNAPGLTAQDVWLGVYDQNSTEDPDFGKYNTISRGYDVLLFDNPYLLTVTSAGNDRGDRIRTGSTQFVTWFQNGFAGNASAGYYLVPNSGSTPAPGPDGGVNGFDTLGTNQKTAKNTVTVGNYSDVLADPRPTILPSGNVNNDFEDDGSLGLAASSSFGPTDDGRIKPDVVANGVQLFSSVAFVPNSDPEVASINDYGTFTGTSMAAPSVSGLSALLVQHYRNLHGSDPRSATLKGLLIHTASDVGNPGPDYRSGWGLVDAQAAAGFLSKQTDRVSGETHFLQEAVLPSLGTYSHSFKISGGPLRVTIAWTDPAAVADGMGVDSGTAAKLVNDLDLQVIGPNGTALPWILDPVNPNANATRGRNFRDNVEQVLIDAPVSGTYILRVNHTGALQNSAPQAFSILASARLIDPDDCEKNDTIATACVLGSVNEIVLRNLTIHTTSDEDFFRYTAHQTGRIVVNTRFLHSDGDLDLQIQDKNGNVLASSDSVDDDETIEIPVVSQQDYYIRVFGVGGALGDQYALEIENFAVPVSTLVDLPDRFDSGRRSDDNLTNFGRPGFDVYVDLENFLDPDGDGVAFTNLLGASAFEEDVAGVYVELFTPFGSLGFADPVPGSMNLWSFSPNIIAFPDDVHAIRAAVRINDDAKQFASDADKLRRTGRGLLSPPLLITIDTVAPSTPTIGLDPSGSDTGISTSVGTFSDRVTRELSPSFVGVAEAGSLVRFFADGTPFSENLIDGSDVFGGQTLVTPADYGTEPGRMVGTYRHSLALNLNGASFGFPTDGRRQVGVIAEDLAGNLSEPEFLDILVDTTPPRIASIDLPNGSTVFATKPEFAPSPVTNSLLITFSGGPASELGLGTPAIDPGRATDVKNYRISGDHTGNIRISSASVVSASPQTVVVRLTFSEPLPDDRFTISVLDSVSDGAGNKLDGESQASAPGTAGALLPSGNGLPGGGFEGRFTIDSRPEIGTVAQGIAYIDINGNFEWDPQGSSGDVINRDFVLQMGTLTDAHFAGNFAPVGALSASGFDKLGVYGKFGPTYSFLIDTNDDGVGDFASVMPSAYQVNGIPVAGNFNASHPGDEIGLFDGSAWYLDVNGNNQIDIGEKFASNFNGIPVVGDFNGDGADDLATYANDSNSFFFDTNRDGRFDYRWDVRDSLQRFGGLGGFTDRPVAGDLNLDGIDDLGLWVKGRGGQLPAGSGEYFFWVSDRKLVNPALVFDAYSPFPLGNDLFAQFGNENALPIFGNFDPPIEQNSSSPRGNLLHRSSNPLDTDGDNFITPLDVLAVINSLNSGEPISMSDPVRALATVGGSKLDVDNDWQVSPLDALAVINYLNSANRQGGGEGEAATEGDLLSVSVRRHHEQVDDYFSWIDTEEWLPNRRRRS